MKTYRIRMSILAIALAILEAFSTQSVYGDAFTVEEIPFPASGSGNVGPLLSDGTFYVSRLESDDDLVVNRYVAGTYTESTMKARSGFTLSLIDANLAGQLLVNARSTTVGNGGELIIVTGNNQTNIAYRGQLESADLDEDGVVIGSAYELKSGRRAVRQAICYGCSTQLPRYWRPLSRAGGTVLAMEPTSATRKQFRQKVNRLMLIAADGHKRSVSRTLARRVVGKTILRGLIDESGTVVTTTYKTFGDLSSSPILSTLHYKDDTLTRVGDINPTSINSCGAIAGHLDVAGHYAYAIPKFWSKATGLVTIEEVPALVAKSAGISTAGKILIDVDSATLVHVVSTGTAGSC